MSVLDVGRSYERWALRSIRTEESGVGAVGRGHNLEPLSASWTMAVVGRPVGAEIDSPIRSAASEMDADERTFPFRRAPTTGVALKIQILAQHDA